MVRGTTLRDNMHPYYCFLSYSIKKRIINYQNNLQQTSKHVQDFVQHYVPEHLNTGYTHQGDWSIIVGYISGTFFCTGVIIIIVLLI